VLQLAQANKQKARSRTVLTTLTSLAVGAGVGTLAGLAGGPPGMVLGAVLGAAVGGGVGYGAGRVLDNSKQIDAELRAHAHTKGWVDGSQCMRCRREFSLVRRHHHCRACGGIFCDACSSQRRHVHYEGLEHPVHTRVCDTCVDARPAKFVAPTDRPV
jgi:FYVE zinc finger